MSKKDDKHPWTSPTPVGFDFLRTLPPEFLLLETLHRWAGEHYGDQALPSAWREFCLFAERPMDPLTEPELTSLFMAWSVFHWQPKHHRFPNQPIAKHYLENKRPTPSSPIPSFLRAALRCPYRFFQVCQAEPAEGLLLHDLFLGQDLRLPPSPSGTSLREGEILYALLLPVAGQACLYSSAPVRFQAKQGELLLEYREDMVKRLGPLTETKLLEHAIELRTLYFQAKTREEAEARLPQNRDGHDFVPLRAMYGLECPLDAALEALLPLSGEKDLETFRARSLEGSSSSQYREHRFPLFRRSPPSPEGQGRAENLKGPMKDEGDLTIGWMEIDKHSLVFFTNSEERAEEIHAEIEQLLGERALYAGLEDLDPDHYRDRMRDVPASRGRDFW